MTVQMIAPIDCFQDVELIQVMLCTSTITLFGMKTNYTCNLRGKFYFEISIKMNTAAPLRRAIVINIYKHLKCLQYSLIFGKYVIKLNPVYLHVYILIKQQFKVLIVNIFCY
jgi:hypothetical protein